MAQNIDKPDKPYKRNVHSGHRKRIRENFLKNGLDDTQEHNVLELALFYAIPRKDTNEIAHYLINQFGSFAGVLDAPIEALTEIDGIGTESAVFLKLLPELFKFYEKSKSKDTKGIFDSKTAIKYMSGYFVGARVEKFVVMFLDAKGRIITCSEIAQGSDTMVHVDFNTVLKKAVMLDAKGLVVAHNHPNGFAVPSKEDKVMTEKLSNLCKTLDIVLCEHIIFSGSETCLLSKAKGMKPGTCIF